MPKTSNCLAVLQAGGKGTRMYSITNDRVPKVLLPIGGRPMLEWQILNLSKYGIKDFVIIVGHLGDQIMSYFGDGSNLEVNINYIVESEPLGSGGALTYLTGKIDVIDHIILALGDVMFDIDVNRFISFHKVCGGLATLLVHPNAHPHDSDLVVLKQPEITDEEAVALPVGGLITGFDSKKNVRNYYYDNCVNAGLYLLEPKVILGLGPVRPLDLEKEILLPYIEKNRLFGYHTTEYVKDAGTPERYRMVEMDLEKGILKNKNLLNPQRAIFFDRDGTLNEDRGLISSVDAFKLLPGAATAVKKVNDSGYLAIVVTNQPVVARGMCSVVDVQKIHRKLQDILGKEGAYLDDIIFCPHHPHKGYPEENKAYKMDCSCRKPKTGMIDIMAKRYNIDLQKSWFVGDSARDMECGRRAGTRTALVDTEKASVGKYDEIVDIYVADVLEAVEKILK